MTMKYIRESVKGYPKKVRYPLILCMFSGLYVYSLDHALKSDNEYLRIGAAGSITTLLSESTFYPIDAIN